MTPLALELAGFGCYRDRVEISFEELELFAIAGPTGAGKSTLLDAITYALYGQTARLGSRGLDVLISPGCDRLEVALTFRAGAHTYRVTRVAERRPSGSVARETRIEQLTGDGSWKQLPASEKLREADQKLIEIVGLDYEGFTRAVLLPQGAFDEFLRGDSAKRRKLLVTLLGLDRVEQMQKLAGRRARQAETEAKALERRLEQDYQGATPARKRQLSDEVATLEAGLAQKQAELTRREAELRELDELRGLVERWRSARAERQQLDEQAERMAAERARLERARRARMLAPQVRHLAEARRQVERAEGELAAARSEQAAAEAALERSRAEAREAEARAAARLPEIQATLTRLAAVAPLQRQLQARGGSLALAAEADPEAPFDEAAWEALQADQQALAELRRHEADLAAATRGLEREGARRKTLAAEIADEQRRRDEIVTDGKRVKEAWDAARQAVEEAERADLARTLRSGLAAGDPCPVCGRPIAELPADEAHDLDELRAKARQLEGQRNNLLEAYNALDGKLRSDRERLSDLDARLAEAQQQVEALQAKRAAALQALSAFATAGVLADPSAGTSPKKPAAADLADGTADVIADVIAARLEARRRTLLASLAHAIVEVTNGQEPKQLQAQLEREQRTLEQARRDAAEHLAAGERRLAALHSRVEAAAGGLEARRQELSSREQELTDALAEAGFATADEVAAAALDDEQLARLEAEIDSYEARRTAAARSEVELEAAIAGRTFDPEAWTTAQQERERLANEIDAGQQQLGRLREQLEQVTAALERARELRAELQVHQQTHETYRQLSLDLRSNAFQAYLMEQVQRTLAARASTIIREVTDGRYDLRLIDDEYYVQDAWNGDELRSAKTLSGGETFIASLALALALSDTVAGNRVLGALFLDEGFGSLDADTLDAVAAVLEALTREGRMVGIITHVTALTERLPVSLVVEKGPAGSSVRWGL